ncbi:MAG: replicative DNA helicase [Cyanobacteria bacterium DS2.3.42]|nr:replicative DNA helicase [Cyanobacteria bacterium DS2.3.42]
MHEGTLERMPPQSIEAEQAVLGSLMVTADGITRVVDVLQPEYFYRKAHQVIYAAMMDLYEKSEPIDIVTISQYLKDEDKLDHVGGRQYITDLALAVATTANLEYYAKTVEEKALLRQLIKSGTEIVQSAYEETDATVAIDKAEHLIFGLAERRNLQQLVHIKHIVESSFQKIEQRYEQRDALSGAPSGFYDLDAMTSGFQPSDLVIIAARPSMGKTAFVLNIAQHMATDANVPVAVFSLEMSREQLVMRMLCAEAGIDANRLRTGNLHSNDWTQLAMAMGRLGEAPIFIDDSAMVTANEIRAKCRRLKAENKGLGLIVIDYIQLMQGRKQTDNRQQEVSEISRALKQLARELSCPVLALSQLSRAVEARQNKRPMLSDLRESGCLTGDTQILLPETGEYVRMDSLIGKTGFKVMALNTYTWKLEPKTVTNAFSTGTKQTYKLITGLNRQIHATGNHKFLTIDGWKRLDLLKPGDKLAIPADSSILETIASTDREGSVNQRGGVALMVREAGTAIRTLGDVYWDPIVSIEPADVVEVYDLTVEDHHNFVANDIIVHNSIEQDADLVMFIYRDEYYNPESDKRGEAEIIIAKQRNGPVGTVDLLFQSSVTKFLNKVHNQFQSA